MKKKLFRFIFTLFLASIAVSYSLAQGGVGGAPTNIGIYVTTNDVLWFQYTGTFSGTVFQTFRILKTDGTIYSASIQGTAWSVTCSPAANGQGTGIQVPVTGWLVGTESQINSGSVLSGQAYVNHYILNSMPTGGGTSTCVGTMATSNISTLLAGANTSQFFPVAWTAGGGNLIQSPLAGPGYPQNQSISNPAAGANVPLTTIGGGNLTQRTQVVAIHFRLVSSATVASRIVCITLGTSGGTVLTTACGIGTQAASQTVDYDFMIGSGSSCPTALITGTNCITPLPNNYFLQGGVDDSLATAITGIQATDQISNVWVKKLLWQEVD